MIAQRIVCVNHPQKEVILARGIPSEKIEISMNVPDHLVFDDRLIEKVEESTFNLVYHGSLQKRLGVDIAIKAVAKLKDKLPELRFNIFGGGDDIDEFKTLLAEKNIGLHITTRCYQWLAKKAYSKLFGAREVARIVEDKIKSYFVDEVLFGKLSKGGKVTADIKADDVVFRHAKSK